MKKSYFLEKDDIQIIIAEKFNTDPANVKVGKYSANVMITEELQISKHQQETDE